MDTVRIGLLGAGMISQKHLNMYAQIPEAQVVAVCSRTQQSAERCAQQFGIPNVYTDYTAMLQRDDIDDWSTAARSARSTMRAPLASADATGRLSTAMAARIL